MNSYLFKTQCFVYLFLHMELMSMWEKNTLQMEWVLGFILFYFALCRSSKTVIK